MDTSPRTMPRRVLVGVIALVVGAGVLGGCSRSEANPSADPTTAVSSPATSPTPTATATPTPDASVMPVRPAAMDEVSAAGAEAVAVYFLQLFPYIFATGDLTEWKALSHAECVYCANVTSGVEQMWAAGHRSVGGFEIASAVTSTVIDPGRWWLVSLTLVEKPSKTVDGGGAVVEEFPNAKTYKSDVAVVRETGRWVIREVTHARQS